MSRRSLSARSALALAAGTLTLFPASPASAHSGGDPDERCVEQRYSAEEIDKLLGPIALYPDALLAQVLIAATFPDQNDCRTHQSTRGKRALASEGPGGGAETVSLKRTTAGRGHCKGRASRVNACGEPAAQRRAALPART